MRMREEEQFDLPNGAEEPFLESSMSMYATGFSGSGASSSGIVAASSCTGASSSGAGALFSSTGASSSSIGVPSSSEAAVSLLGNKGRLKVSIRDAVLGWMREGEGRLVLDGPVLVTIDQEVFYNSRASKVTARDSSLQ